MRFTAALLPLCLALGLNAPPAEADERAGRSLGNFRVTFYFVAEERADGGWPLYAPACQEILAFTSREFHHQISLEGTGRLLDGRLLNFSERCGCAHAGHGGSRICYEVVDPGTFPWGKGGKLSGRDLPLRPFRSLAVDPALIPLGTVLYVPAWRGGNWPDGTPRDGCFRAEDSGAAVRGRHVDVFAGRPDWAELLGRNEPERLRVFADSPACEHLTDEG
jgi:3D (Asp-Asp-Asp) domain-containing protein